MSKSKNNYNKMYDAAGKREEVEPVETAVAEPAVETVKMERPVDAEAVAKSRPVDAEAVAKSKPAKTKAKPVVGTVTCALLNVRVAPNMDATVECVLAKDSKVTINLAESTDEWYKVVTKDKTTGYCMKKFIAV